jgi:hypothetical protein
VPAGTRDVVSCTAVDDAGNEAQMSPLVYIRIP